MFVKILQKNSNPLCICHPPPHFAMLAVKMSYQYVHVKCPFCILKVYNANECTSIYSTIYSVDAVKVCGRCKHNLPYAGGKIKYTIEENLSPFKPAPSVLCSSSFSRLMLQVTSSVHKVDSRHNSLSASILKKKTYRYLSPVHQFCLHPPFSQLIL